MNTYSWDERRETVIAWLKELGVTWHSFQCHTDDTYTIATKDVPVALKLLRQANFEIVMSGLKRIQFRLTGDESEGE